MSGNSRKVIHKNKEIHKVLLLYFDSINRSVFEVLNLWITFNPWLTSHWFCNLQDSRTRILVSQHAWFTYSTLNLKLGTVIFMLWKTKFTTFHAINYARPYAFFSSSPKNVKLTEESLWSLFSYIVGIIPSASSQFQQPFSLKKKKFRHELLHTVIWRLKIQQIKIKPDF